MAGLRPFRSFGIRMDKGTTTRGSPSQVDLDDSEMQSMQRGESEMAVTKRLGNHKIHIHNNSSLVHCTIAPVSTVKLG